MVQSASAPVPAPAAAAVEHVVAMSSRNTFVYFVVLIRNIFLFTINTHNIQLNAAAGGGVEGCARCTSNSTISICVSIFPMRAQDVVSAEETLFASFFAKICCGIYLYYLKFCPHTRTFECWRCTASEIRTKITQTFSAQCTVHTRMTEFALVSLARKTIGHKTNRMPNNKHTHPM